MMMEKKSNKNKIKKKIDDETYVPKAFRKEEILDNDKDLKEEDIPKLLKKEKQNGKHGIKNKKKSRIKKKRKCFNRRNI